jgi:hypothetical protein
MCLEEGRVKRATNKGACNLRKASSAVEPRIKGLRGDDRSK